MRRYGPSYEAGLFDQLDEDFFSISAEDGDIELQEDNVDNNTSEPIYAASEAMKGDDDAATKASE